MSLPPAARSLLAHVPPEFEQRWAARLNWRLRAHPGQLPPPGDWAGWMIRAGRGYGKTLAAAWWITEAAVDNPGWRIGIIAPTFGDVRDICLEGSSGILTVAGDGPPGLPGLGVDVDYNRTLAEITFPNGTRVKGYGAEKPDRLRGPQHHTLWFEEVAAWRDAAKGDVMLTAYNTARLGLRLGGRARWVGTSTPRHNPLILTIDTDPQIVTTRGATADNLDNLSPSFATTVSAYAGTALERQELHGEIIELVGSIIRPEWFTHHQITETGFRLADGTELTPDTTYITCDPALSTKETADWTVFAVWYQTGDHRALVDVYRARLEAPDVVHTAKRLAAKWGASWVGFEATAYQTALVQYAQREGLPARPLRADRDKVTRAQPLAALIRAGKVTFTEAASWLPDLERELVEFPDGPHDDQVDALAYGTVAHARRYTIRKIL